MKVVPDTVGPVRFNRASSLESCADTISNSTSAALTAGPNLTVQVRVMLDPTGRMRLAASFVTTTEEGAGTNQHNIIIKINYNVSKG